MIPREDLPPRAKSLVTSSSPKTALIYFFLALFLYDLVRRTRRWYRLRHVPGPWICGWTSLWLLRQHLGPRIDQSWKKLVEEYGPVVRMAPNEILLADADELLRIQSPRSLYRKDDWYQIGQMSPPHHNLLSMQDKEARRERKRKVGPGYNGLGGCDFEEGLNKAIAAWISLLERKYVPTNKPLDFALQAHYYALDSLGEIAYSRQLGFLQNDADMHRILETNEQVMPVMFLMSNFVGLGKHLKRWPLSLLLPRDGDQVGFGAIMGVTAAIVDARLAESSSPKTQTTATEKKKKKDILQSFITEGLTRDELNSEVTIQFFVGSDTVASLIRMTLLFLLANPGVYSTLQAEIDHAVANGMISSPVSDAEARQHLPYLQAVLRESLRFFPPVACGVFYKNVPRQGDILAGYSIPGGTKVSTVAGLMALNRDRGIWGDDADVFRPGRWVDAEENAKQGKEEKLRVMSRIVELNFGGGQFLCSGQKIALMQGNKVLPELLRRYDFALVDPLEPIKIRGAIAWMAHDFWVKVEKRGAARAVQ